MEFTKFIPSRVRQFTNDLIQSGSMGWLIAILLLFIATPFVAAIFAILQGFLPTPFSLSEFQKAFIPDWLLNSWTEFLGIFAGVTVIDALRKYADLQSFKDKIKRQARSQTNANALDALETIHDYKDKWLYGEKLGIFEEMNFRNGKLKGANFQDATMYKTDFESADLTSVNFNFAELLEVPMRMTSLLHTTFIDAGLENVKFSCPIVTNKDNTPKSQIKYVNFLSATLTDCDFSGSLLRLCLFSPQAIKDVVKFRDNISPDKVAGNDKDLYEEMKAISTNIEPDQYTKTVFSGTTNFSGSRLEGIILKVDGTHRALNLDLSGINFQGASFEGATLTNTTFAGIETSLEKANFLGANLKDVNFSGANLTGVSFGKDVDRAAIIERCDFSRSILKNSYLQRISLVGINLRHADLSGAFCEDATFSKSDLRGSDLSGARLQNANLINQTTFDGATRLPNDEAIQTIWDRIIKSEDVNIAVNEAISPLYKGAISSKYQTRWERLLSTNSHLENDHNKFRETILDIFEERSVKKVDIVIFVQLGIEYEHPRENDEIPLGEDTNEKQLETWEISVKIVSKEKLDRPKTLSIEEYEEDISF